MAQEKPRIVVLTDIAPDNVEPDDMESIIRLFVQADMFEIEGLIHSTGWSADSAKASYYQLIHEAIDLYEKDLLFIWDESAWKYQNGAGRRNWNEYATHIRNHGNLGKMYPRYKYGVEGDTPAFLHIIPTGLNNPDVPGQVGWGGYFEFGECKDEATKAYQNHDGSANRISSNYQQYLYPATFSNFAARMDWAKYGAGNRNPNVVVRGDAGLAGFTLTPAPGAYDKDVQISGGDSARATVAVPSDASGKTFHVICEAKDDGAHNLTSYRRIVIEPTATAANN